MDSENPRCITTDKIALGSVVVLVVYVSLVVLICLLLSGQRRACHISEEVTEPRVEYVSDPNDGGGSSPTTDEKKPGVVQTSSQREEDGGGEEEEEGEGGPGKELSAETKEEDTYVKLDGIWKGRIMAVYARTPGDRPSAFELSLGGSFQLKDPLRLYPCTIHSPAFLSPPVVHNGPGDVVLRFQPKLGGGGGGGVVDLPLRPILAPIGPLLPGAGGLIVVEGPEGTLLSARDPSGQLVLSGPTAEGVVVVSTSASASQRGAFAPTHFDVGVRGGEDPFCWFKEYDASGTEKVVIHYKPTTRNPEPRFLSDIDRYLPSAIELLTEKLGLPLGPDGTDDAGAGGATDVYLVHTSDRWGKAHITTGSEPMDRPFLLEPGTYAFAKGTELDTTTPGRMLDYSDMYVVCGSGEDAHDPVTSGALAGSCLVHELFHVAQMKRGFPLHLPAGADEPARSWAPWCSEGPAVLCEVLLAYHLLSDVGAAGDRAAAVELAEAVLKDYALVAAWEAHLPMAVPTDGMNPYGSFFVHLFWALRRTTYVPDLVDGGAQLLADLRISPAEPGFVASGVPLLDPNTLRPLFRHGQDNDLARRAFTWAATGEENGEGDGPERCVHSAVTALMLEGLGHQAFCPEKTAGERDPFGIGWMLGYYFLIVASVFRDDFVVEPSSDPPTRRWTTPGPAAAGGGSIFRQLSGLVPAGSELKRRNSKELPEEEEDALISVVFLSATGQLLGAGASSLPCVVPQGAATVYISATALRHSARGVVVLETVSSPE